MDGWIHLHIQILIRLEFIMEADHQRMVGSSEVNFSPSLSTTTCMATMEPEPSHFTNSQHDHRVFPRELTAFFCARFLSFS
jgi:hypothetical protein